MTWDNNLLKLSNIFSLMNDPKILYAHDLEHGHFYRDLDNKIFCWIEGDGKGSPKYFNGNHPSIPKRSKVSTYLILDKGVVEVDLEEPMTTLRNELLGRSINFGRVS